MATWPMRRLAALGAVAFAVLNVVAFAIPGSPPHFGDSGAKIAGWFTDHHRAAVIAVLLIWVAVVILVGVLAQLVDIARESGRFDSATAITIAGAAAVATLTVAVAAFGAVTQLAVNGTNPGVVRATYELAMFVFTGLNWVMLALVVALARAALNGVFPRWSVALNGIVAAGLVLGGLTVRGSGVLAAGTGAFAYIGTFATFVLFLEIAVLLWRAAPARAAARTPATSTV